MTPPTECSIAGCAETARCRGMCNLHYRRWMRTGDPHFVRTPLLRYEAKIDRSGGPDACHLWIAGRSRLGYGAFQDGRSFLAHVWGYANGEGVDSHGHALGSIPPETPCVCHTCDTPLCQNQRHWWLGTRSDNNADRHAKGRSKGGRTGPGRPASGERQHNAKLTEQDVRAIRSAGGVTQKTLAARYGVQQTTISGVIRRQTWAHVQEEAPA